MTFIILWQISQLAAQPTSINQYCENKRGRKEFFDPAYCFSNGVLFAVNGLDRPRCQRG